MNRFIPPLPLYRKSGSPGFDLSPRASYSPGRLPEASPPSASLLIGLYEIIYRAVVCLFHIVRKEAGRKLAAVKMVLKAIAAYAFSAAWLISAIATVLICLYGTFFHSGPLKYLDAPHTAH